MARRIITETILVPLTPKESERAVAQLLAGKGPKGKDRWTKALYRTEERPVQRSRGTRSRSAQA